MPTSSRLTLLPHSISPKPSRKKLRPMVAMNRMMAAWLTSGRRTTRSMATASATIMPIVRASAMATGTPRSIKPTRVSAAKSTITPWAKLKTPDALKISTKPRATSEYMSPAAMPPRSTSTKNAGAVTMSRNGVTRPSRTSLMAQPEVGVEHGLVLTHLAEPAICDLPPIIQHGHAIGDVHDHAHVVLDQRDGGPELAVGVEDEAAHVFLLLDVHPRHRLVQQQERRLGRQRPGQLHALLQAVGQPARRRLADGLDLQEVDDALDERPVLELLAPGRAEPDCVEQERAAHLEQPPRHDVVEHGHALEKRDVLEGAGHAESGHVGRGQPRPVPAGEGDAPLVRMIEAADHVEERRFPRPVGSDDREDLAGTDVETHAVQRQQRPEANAHALDGEQRSLAAMAVHRRASPPERTAWIRTPARMVPVRPSSYVTCASTSTRSRSP